MRQLKIAYGSSCFAKKWSNKTIGFDELCEQFRVPVRTSESAEEYPKLPKAERDRIKDIGGIVPAELRDGRRKSANVNCCSMIKLDGDKVKTDFLEKFETHNEYAAVIYSTQNVEECLKSETARLMLANSEFLLMLNQAATDRAELAKILNISNTQLGHITNAAAGRGLLKFGGSIVPFINDFPSNTELYKLMSTKPGDE